MVNSITLNITLKVHFGVLIVWREEYSKIFLEFTFTLYIKFLFSLIMECLKFKKRAENADILVHCKCKNFCENLVYHDKKLCGFILSYTKMIISVVTGS